MKSSDVFSDKAKFTIASYFKKDSWEDLVAEVGEEAAGWAIIKFLRPCLSAGFRDFESGENYIMLDESVFTIANNLMNLNLTNEIAREFVEEFNDTAQDELVIRLQKIWEGQLPPDSL